MPGNGVGDHGIRGVGTASGDPFEMRQKGLFPDQQVDGCCRDQESGEPRKKRHECRQNLFMTPEFPDCKCRGGKQICRIELILGAERTADQNACHQRKREIDFFPFCKIFRVNRAGDGGKEPERARHIHIGCLRVEKGERQQKKGERRAEGG